jgi:L-2-hydroxyglutarate oxidase LhgO
MFGPDVEWVNSVDYDVNPSKEDEFYNAIRTYWPGLRDGTLHPAYSGIRPKIVGPGKPDADFCIQYEKTHGVRGLVNLYGIESPGLTASLAIAESVALSIATMA